MAGHCFSYFNLKHIYICLTFILSNGECIPTLRGRCDRDRIIIGFTTTYAISVSCKFESRSWRGVRDTTLCDKVCDWSGAFSGTPVSSTNKTNRHDITEILLKP